MRLLQLAWKTISGNGLRSWVVALCALLVAAFALFATLLLHEATTSLELAADRLGADIVVVPEGAQVRMEGALLMGVPAHFWMPEENVAKLAAIPGVEAVSPQIYLATLKSASCCSVSEMFMVAYDPQTDFTVRPWLAERHLGDLGLGEVIGGDYISATEGKDGILVYGTPVRLKAKLEPTGAGLDQTLFFTLETAQEMARNSKTEALEPLVIPPNQVSAVLLRTKPGSDNEQIAVEIYRTIPGVYPIESSKHFQSSRVRLHSLLNTVAIILALIWPLAVIAITTAVSFGAEKRARTLAENLARGSLALSQTLDAETTLNTLLDQLSQMVPYDGAAIALLKEEAVLAVRAVRGDAWPRDALQITYAVDVSPEVQEALATQQAVLIRNTASRVGWRHHAGLEGIASWLGVPLVVGGKVVGLCELYRIGSEYFSDELVHAATALIAQAAGALQNVWLFGQVRAGRERLRVLSRRLVEVQEAEGRYVARELHDDVAQALASIKMELALLTRDAGCSEKLRAGLDHLKGTADGAMDSLQRLAKRLRPATLDHLGLVAALRQYVDEMRERHNLAMDLVVVGFRDRMPSEVETALYRIVQEALVNVVRHARAHRVDVLLEEREDRLVVLVEDDGIGLDTEAVAKTERLGLYGMRERAEMLGGSLVVESTPGHGTTILVEVPHGDPNPDSG